MNRIVTGLAEVVDAIGRGEAGEHLLPQIRLQRGGQHVPERIRPLPHPCSFGSGA
ncbi:hypothetical protein [Streptomyces sp. NPDC088785]|uniref:hypothetical protein n=1 Tax=Streptomyces sp. NPDC088785 TaxID=3365897 RepID=UPI00381FFBBE